MTTTIPIRMPPLKRRASPSPACARAPASALGPEESAASAEMLDWVGGVFDRLIVAPPARGTDGY